MLLFSSCSSINVQTAQTLAEEGNRASLQIAESYRKRAADMEFYLEGEYILSGLKKGYSPPGSRMVEKITSLEKEMRERQNIFANFAKVYRSFANLALFDKTDDIKNSLRNLTDAVNIYSETTSGRKYFTETDKDLAALAGRHIFTAYHLYKLKTASQLIRKRLDGAKKLITAQSEKSAILAMDEEMERNRLKVTVALWDTGMGLPYGIIAEHIENYGLQVNRKETITQISRATTGDMSSAVKNILKFRHKREIRRKQEAYNASIAVLQTLITAHRQFEHGDPLSLSSLNTLLRTVRRYTELIKVKNEEKQIPERD